MEVNDSPVKFDDIAASRRRLARKLIRRETMCDRYSLGVDMEMVSEDETVVRIAWQLEPKSYVVPGRRGPVLLRRGSGLTVTLGSWGLPGGWRLRDGVGGDELLTQVPLGQVGMMPEWIRGLQRCAIPADGFVGVAQEPGARPWRIGRPDGRIFWMAGFWSPGGSEADAAFAVLTAPQYVAGVGFVERAPVLLVGPSVPGWLSPRVSGGATFTPVPSAFLTGFPVGELAEDFPDRQPVDPLPIC